MDRSRASVLLLLGFCIGIVLFVLLDWIGDHVKPAGAEPAPATIVAPSPDPRDPVWAVFDVGGMVLCTAPDSTAHGKCIIIPAGSRLLVPSIPNIDPDSVATERKNKT